MKFIGVSKRFSCENQGQFEAIGSFYDLITKQYNLEDIRGLGYKWKDNYIYYAIGLKSNELINNYQEYGHLIEFEYDENSLKKYCGKTDELESLYYQIYLENSGKIEFEIEEFYNDGSCIIYISNKKKDNVKNKYIPLPDLEMMKEDHFEESKIK